MFSCLLYRFLTRSELSLAPIAAGVFAILVMVILDSDLWWLPALFLIVSNTFEEISVVYA